MMTMVTKRVDDRQGRGRGLALRKTGLVDVVVFSARSKGSPSIGLLLTSFYLYGAGAFRVCGVFFACPPSVAHFLENFTFSDPGAIPNGAFGEVLGCVRACDWVCVRISVYLSKGLCVPQQPGDVHSPWYRGSNQTLLHSCSPALAFPLLAFSCWPKGQGPVNPEDKSPFVVKCIDYNKHAGICRKRGHKMHECPDKELKREKELLLIAQVRLTVPPPPFYHKHDYEFELSEMRPLSHTHSTYCPPPDTTDCCCWLCCRDSPRLLHTMPPGHLFLNSAFDLHRTAHSFAE